jgi:predicted acylesterase/phospholipase RssA
MTQVSPPGTSDAQPPEPGHDDLRLALVLNGGVSLAVWISGVVHEIDALRTAGRLAEADDDPNAAVRGVYERLLRIVRYRPHVDVIAGTSAGGINGALLAASITGGTTYGNVLADAWLPLGDLHSLVLVPGAKSNAILDGDLMLREIRRQLARRLGPQPGVAADAEFPPGSLGERIQRLGVPLASRDTGQGLRRVQAPREVSLILTATDVDGVPRQLQTPSGPYPYREHRLHYRFTSADNPRPGWIPLGGDSVRILAQAARATASFPGAFAPVPLDLGAGAIHRAVTRDGRALDVRGRRWLMDGGVLDNSPFAPLLDELDVMGKREGADRVVLFVVPYPAAEGGGARTREPTFEEIVGAARSLPRQVTTMNDLERLQGYFRRQRRRFEATRRLIDMTEDEGLQVAATPLVEAYRCFRIDSVLLEHGLDPRAVRECDGLRDVDTGGWLPGAVGDARLESGSNWRWGLAPAKRIGAFALVGLHDAREALGATAGALRGTVRSAEGEVHAALARLGALKQILAARREEGWRGVAAPSTADASAARELLGAIGARWSTALAAGVRRAVVEIAELLVQVRDALGDEPGARRALGVPGDVDARGLLERLLLAEIVTDAGSSRGPGDTDDWAAGLRLVRIDSSPWRDMGCMLENPVESLDAGVRGSKLLGLSAHHFGGFLRATWRANDWMWGRLDATGRLVDMLLDERRLRLLYSPTDRDATTLATSIAEAVLDGLETGWESGEETARSLQQALGNEVELFADRGQGERVVPFHLACKALVERLEPDMGAALRLGRIATHADPLYLARRALVWRIQLEIIRVEEGQLRDARTRDWLSDYGSSRQEDGGGGAPASTQEGAPASRSSGQAPTPAAALRTFSRYAEPLLTGVATESRQPKVLAAAGKALAGLWLVLWRRQWTRPLHALGLLIAGLLVGPFYWATAFAFTALLRRAPWRVAGIVVGSLALPAIVGVIAGAAAVTGVPESAGAVAATTPSPHSDDFPVFAFIILVALGVASSRAGPALGGRFVWPAVIPPMLAVTMAAPLLIAYRPDWRLEAVVMLVLSVQTLVLAIVLWKQRIPSVPKALWLSAAAAWAAVGGIHLARAVRGGNTEIWVLSEEIAGVPYPGAVLGGVLVAFYAMRNGWSLLTRRHRVRRAQQALADRRGATAQPEFREPSDESRQLRA